MEGTVLGLGVATVVVGSAVAGTLTGHRLPALVAGIVVALGAAAYLWSPSGSATASRSC